MDRFCGVVALHGQEERDKQTAAEDDGENLVRAAPAFFFAEAFLHVVRRSADIAVAPDVSFPVVQGQRYFGHLGEHAHECADPHPEDSSGPADGYGRCNAADVSGTYGAADCDARGFGCGDRSFAFALGLAHDRAERLLQDEPEMPDLVGSGEERQGDPDAEQHNHQGRTPD